MKRLSALILLALPASGFAACPTVDDLEKGIRFAISGGDAEEFKLHSKDKLVSHFYAQGVLDSRVLLAKGLYLVEYFAVNNGIPDPSTRATYAHELAHGDLPLPMSGGSFAVNVAVNDAGNFSKETELYTFGAETKVQFGSCAYRMIPVEIRYEPNIENSVDTLHWLPELGLSYLAEYRDDSGVDRYTYLSIEAVK